MPGNSDVPPQSSAEPGVSPASTIERAAQRLARTNALRMHHNTSLRSGGPTNLRRPFGPERVTWPPRARPGSAIPTRLPLISLLCLASILVAAAGVGVFLSTHSASEKAAVANAPAGEVSAQASQNPVLSRGLAIMPSADGAAQRITPASLMPTSPPASVISEREQKPPRPVLSAADTATLLSRADWLSATGDVASARLLYERAADAGAPQAAMRLAQTFDPVLLDPHLRDARGDPGEAMFWYHRARDLGAIEVTSRLKSLEAKEDLHSQ